MDSSKIRKEVTSWIVVILLIFGAFSENPMIKYLSCFLLIVLLGAIFLSLISTGHDHYKPPGPPEGGDTNR
jgi:hypothetical protein